MCTSSLFLWLVLATLMVSANIMVPNEADSDELKDAKVTYRTAMQLEQGRGYEAALAKYKEALGAFEAAAGEHCSPEVATTKHNVANLYGVLGQSEDAATTHQAGYDCISQFVKSDAPRASTGLAKKTLLASTINMARSLAVTGDIQEASDYLDKAEQLAADKQVGDDPPFPVILTAYEALIERYISSKEWAQGKKLTLKMVKTSKRLAKKYKDASDKQVQMLQSRVAMACTYLGQFTTEMDEKALDPAMKWYSEADEIISEFDLPFEEWHTKLYFAMAMVLKDKKTNPDTMLEYLLRALEHCHKGSCKIRPMLLYHAASEAMKFKAKSKQKLARDYWQELKGIAHQDNGPESLEFADATERIGHIEANLKNMNKAEDHFVRARKIYHKLGKEKAVEAMDAALATIRGTREPKEPPIDFDDLTGQQFHPEKFW
jgi:tetratricopeptide (TPR) repeat protein|uniref:MalT-like TPR region domain-containing protein n=1 Tax=Eutreptiella gymnastica TaxID=73025 RepID=A0A7S4GHV3_9EUGL|mmetsp:Transcript_51111/g.83963  ORF Transcript_51111/g.83963 Transcript_51111/m.83963 type:complete len:433 (+) Transcript_51111:37-1335(+)